MSYNAAGRLPTPMRHTIDTIGDAWIASQRSAEDVFAWPLANLAIYVPVRIPSPCVVKSLWFGSGGTSTGSVDMALYTSSGAAMIEATAGAKASSMEHVFDTTDTLVGPGLYYIGLSSNSNSDSFVGLTIAAPLALAFGILSQTSAYPLPSSATWAADQTLAVVPIVGLFLSGTVT